MKKLILRLIIRVVLGVVAIYVINGIFDAAKISLKLGVNFYTICTTACLGLPGLTLLYGILGSKYL